MSGRLDRFVDMNHGFFVFPAWGVAVFGAGMLGAAVDRFGGQVFFRKNNYTKYF